MGNMLSQSGWIPTPPLTEQNLPDQTGKVWSPRGCQLRVKPECIDLTLRAQVVIVTGGNAGVGFELCKILYSHNATVYLAGRSEEKCNKALAAIKTAAPDSKGQIAFLKLDLGDLASIKASADEFLSKEKRLDWLCNNAGVMIPPKGSKTTQVRDRPHYQCCQWIATANNAFSGIRPPTRYQLPRPLALHATSPSDTQVDRRILAPKFCSSCVGSFPGHRHPRTSRWHDAERERRTEHRISEHPNDLWRL